MVLLVICGDLSALEHVARAVLHDISVVVVKGTGGAADIIATCVMGLVNEDWCSYNINLTHICFSNM